MATSGSRASRDALESQQVARDAYGIPLRFLTEEEREERNRCVLQCPVLSSYFYPGLFSLKSPVLYVMCGFLVSG